MTSTDHLFQTIPVDADIRQGDIICREVIGGSVPRVLGVIITADCDIAQGKVGAYL